MLKKTMVALLLLLAALPAVVTAESYADVILDLQYPDDRERVQTAAEALEAMEPDPLSEALALYAQGLLDILDARFSTAARRFESLKDDEAMSELLARHELPGVQELMGYAQARAYELQGDYDLAYSLYDQHRVLDSTSRLISLRTDVFPSLFNQAEESLDVGGGSSYEILEMLARCGYAPAVELLTSLSDYEPPPEAPYVFADQALGEAIRKKLGKPSGADVYLSELMQIEQLERKYTEGKGIKSLEDLKHCVGLRVLFVESNPGVSDLTPLKDLTELRRLWIQKNSISDLSPLAGLVDLSELGICHNQVSDLTPLRGMRDLTGLYLNSNPQISDLSPLDDMAALTFFQYGNNKLSSEQIRTFKEKHPSCKLIAKKR